MKNLIQLSLLIVLLNVTSSVAQEVTSSTSSKAFPGRTLTLEPGIGLNPWPMSDLVFSNILQWNISKRLGFVSHSSYAYNNAFLREDNYVKTNYDYSFSQKFGIGMSFYSKHSTHTVSFLAGIRQDAFRHTLVNPDLENVSVAVSVVSPDLGLMYNIKVGKKKYFFSYRMYLPLYPYPFMTSDIEAVDRNLANFSMEFGLGIRLK